MKRHNVTIGLVHGKVVVPATRLVAFKVTVVSGIYFPEPSLDLFNHGLSAHSLRKLLFPCFKVLAA